MENQNDVNTNSNSLLGPLLLGATLGALAGILLAPEKGSETRRKLMNSSELKDRFNEGMKFAQEMAEEAENFAYTHYNEINRKPQNRAGVGSALLVVLAGATLGMLFGPEKFRTAGTNILRQAREQGGKLHHFVLGKN